MTRDGVLGRGRPWVNVEEARRAARRRLPRMIFDFVDGGAEDEVTLSRNRSAFARIGLVPRALVDVSQPRLGTRVLGQEVSLPLVCGPTGMPGLVHPGADIAVARAAARHGTIATVATTSSHSAAEVRSASTGPLWFQLYAWRDRGLTGELIDRAKDAGCGALVFTVDTPIPGRRERDTRNGMTIPPRVSPGNALEMATHLGWLAGLRRGPGISLGNLAGLTTAPSGGALGLAGWFADLFNPSQTWAELEWILDRWQGPVVVKGVMHPEDATRAARLGAAGVVVSNHGGRQLDGAPASIEVLEDVVGALADAGLGRVDVLMDGGVRRGSDIVKALALGARAVLIGRPWLYGLAARGERGVDEVLALLRSELTVALQLLGCPDVTALDRGCLRHLPPVLPS